MTSPDAPVLLAVSHGTSDPAGQRAVSALVHAVAAARPELSVLGGFVDVQQPDVPTSLDTIDDDRAVVIVPLLLSAGHHVRVDLARAARDATRQSVRVTGALGPDPRLTGILATRLAAAGLRPGDRVVLAAAGSRDPDAVADCHTVGEQLAGVLSRPVTVGFISAAHPPLADAIDLARKPAPDHRVVVATYLLAPGYFAGLACAAGADVVSAPLLTDGGEPPKELVEAVIDRYLEAAALM